MKRVLLTLAFVPAVVFAQAKEYHGAIAYSLGTGAHGWASNHPSRAAADKAALSHCRKHAKAKDCKVEVSFVNACAALAVGPDGFGTAWGSLQQAVDDEAFKLCAKHSKACAVVRRVCSDGKG